jgi:hypothetical protein
MYKRCLNCYGRLGTNDEVSRFPVGERLAFDLKRGRLWVVCTHCGGWNLAPIEERWEALEECERLYRSTPVRFATDNIGLARRESGLDLVRIGPARKPEIAVWRYARSLLPRVVRGVGGGPRPGGAGVLGSLMARQLGTDAQTWLRMHARRDRVVHVVGGATGDAVVIRARHLESVELVRPDRGNGWRLIVPHETGPIELASFSGLHATGKLLSALNGTRATTQQVYSALGRLGEAADPESYFGRIGSLVLRTSWGRDPEASREGAVLPANTSETERLAVYLTSRSFWARGGTGSEPRLRLAQLPLEDRLALEIAVTEDAERDAMEGEMAELEAAWREAEEIAAIADGLLDERSTADAPRAAVGPQLLAGLRTLLPVREG